MQKALGILVILFFTALSVFYVQSGDFRFIFLMIFAAFFLFIGRLGVLNFTKFPRYDILPKALAKTPDLGILLISAKGEIKFINKKFELIFELKSKSLCGKNFNELIAKIPEISALHSFEKLKINFLTTQNFMIKKQDSHLRLSVASVLKGGREFDGFIVFIIDATHEARLECERIKHEQMLMTNAKTALVGEMINSISHQQRQPLSSVLLALDEIDECVQEGRAGESSVHILRAKNAAKLMNETISAFRNFYRQGDEMVVFDLKNAISELIFIVKPQMNTNGILLEFDCDDDKFMIKSVPSYVKQILLSLLANAKDELVNFTQDDENFEPKIIISLQDLGGEICVSVSDNGGGVSGDERIFESFYTTKSGGTGMGLYVAKILATEKLGARLELQDRANPTKFALFLRKKEQDV